MASLNIVHFIGNLGADPEVRFTAGGSAVANLRLACTEKTKTKEGTWEDQTLWINVVAFGKDAENAGEFLHKGSSIYVQGRLQERQWNDKEGNKRSTWEVVANRIQFLSKKGEVTTTPKASTGSAEEPF